MPHKIDRNNKCAPKLIFSNNFFLEIFRWFYTLKIDFENQILALFDVYFWPFNKSQEKINTVESRFKKAWFKKESGFKKDCWCNRFFSTEVVWFKKDFLRPNLCFFKGFLVFEIRKNPDLRKILVTPKIFVKSRFHCT